MEPLAAALGANLLMVRLSGHGAVRLSPDEISYLCTCLRTPLQYANELKCRFQGYQMIIIRSLRKQVSQMEGNPKTGELPNGGIAGSQLLEWTSPEILLNDAFDAARCVYHV